LTNVESCTDTFLPKEICGCECCSKWLEAKRKAEAEALAKAKLAPHSLETIIAEAGTSALRSYIRGWWAPVSWAYGMMGYKPISFVATKVLRKEFESVLRDEVTPTLVAMTPEWLFQTAIFQRSIDYWQKSAAMYDVRRLLLSLKWLFAAIVAANVYFQNRYAVLMSLIMMWSLTMILWSHYRSRIRILKDEYTRRRDAVPAYKKEWMESNAVKGTLAVIATGLLVKLLIEWNKKRIEDNLKAQGSSGPLSVDSLEHSPGWFGSLLKFSGFRAKAAGDTSGVFADDMVQAFKKNNLFYAKYIFADGRSTHTNIYFPRKNIALIPYHVYFPQAMITNEKPNMDIIVTVYRHEKESGGIHEFRCDETTSYVIPELDMVMLYTPKCPDYKDRSKWLVKDKPTGNGQCYFSCRKGSEHKQERVYVNFKEECHSNWNKTFWGGRYATCIAEPGSCMGLVTTDSKEPSIVGFHIAGNATTGAMQTLTYDVYEKALKELSNLPGVMLSANSGEIPEEQYGLPVIVSPEVHPKAMAASLPPHASAIVLGSTKRRTVQRSVVEKSILSDKVAEHFGVPNKWGPPKLKPNWEAYNKNLEHIINPGKMFVPRKLERARRDWVDPLKVLMKEFTLKNEVRPLTMKEAILGIDGMRFIDAIPMLTSMGFPVFGPKNKWFEEVREGEKLLDRVPHEKILEECERMRQCWLRGERAYPVTTATLKDEPTELTSEKVRVFQAACVAMSLWIRSYFLPIARFLQLHPVESESAVGVNAFSDQWEELIGAATKFNIKKLLALDHSKFDVRMNCQVTTSVWRSFIDLAEVAGYSCEDLHIMRMMINDIVHPLIDFNGTMILAMSMNTSGNNLTVNVNGAANSLYMRMAFFDEYPEVESFRDAVAMITYGDDLIGSVNKAYPRFTFKSIKYYLARFGLKVTPPNKTDEEMDYLPFEEADFLKRKSNYIPDINCSIGCLCKDSIFKSLHANLKSRTASKREIAISCIDGAMHEMFAHGKDEYEKFQETMLKVCEDVDMLVPSVKATWDERVLHWIEKYRPQDLANSVKEIRPQDSSWSTFMSAETGCYAKTQY
jgi:hypothetical protein